MRIVSLLASGTEIACEIGAGGELVGRSHECDNPDWVRKLPSCTRPAFDVEMSSRAIDLEVRRRVKKRAPLYYIDAELIERLHPDLLITQEHCEVCAVTPGDIVKSGCEGFARQVLALHGGTVEGIYEDVRQVGRAINRKPAAKNLVTKMRGRLNEIHESVRRRSTSSVVILEWTDPIFAASNWAPELVKAANGKLLLGRRGEHSAAISWKNVCQADPDFLIVAPCGFNLERTLREIPVLEALPGWFELRAVKSGRVFFADGNKFFNRSGTTIVETAEIVAEILHRFRFGESWEERAWQRYTRSPALGRAACGGVKLRF
jgi:iron complex transport system substrate-binding protein